jgi:hypothetical protein
LIVGLNLKKKALDTYQKLRIGVESEANLALKGYLKAPMLTNQEI